MSNAPTPDDLGRDRPNDAEPFFPSEGSFNTVVPLSEIGGANAPAVLPPADPADIGRPAEAAWAREAHRARVKEDEETLVPPRAARARRERRSWVGTAVVIALSVAAGLASGIYLIWSAQRAREAQTPAQVATETPSLPPAPVPERAEAVTDVNKANEPVKNEKPREVVNAEKSNEAARSPKQATPLQPAPAPRAERVIRAADEAREVTPAPKPARTRSATPTRPATVAQQPPKATPSEHVPPISPPPPTAKSKKVIQWP